MDENGTVKEHVHRDVCVCVTVCSGANDAGILLGPCHSILTQVANMAGIVKKIHACAD
jgi:hypothetical protein